MPRDRALNSASKKGTFTNYVNSYGGGGVVKMFTLHYKPYRVKWFTKGEGGVKIIKKHVHVVCERPLIM